ncbi:XRE family transcriptional regulator [Allokutzneria oryzae]|uniref:XRE family transcriptional regulator n=1 Tax=Allokutzneria oryzae TaxID=1378989 RepID=A0ABV5ZVH9_9PSEU
MTTDAHAAARAFDPARLSMARELAGLRRHDLAEAIAGHAATISQYELGQARPTAETLERCAERLGVGVGFFSSGRPHLRLDTAHAHFRSLRATTAAQRGRALAHVELLWEVANALDGVVELPRIDLGLPLGLQHGDAAHNARAVRKAWGVHSGPVAHLVRNLESRGVVVSRLPSTIGTSVEAFSSALHGRPMIVLTEQQDALRQRFSVAHELGHLLLHPDAAPGSRKHESEADAFAAEFLMPAEEITETFPARADLTALKELSDSYGVSVSALAARGRSLGLLTDAAHRRLLTTITKLGWRTAEPVDREHSGERPELLSRAADLAGEHGLPLSALAVCLHVDVATLRGLVGFTEARPRLRLV